MIQDNGGTHTASITTVFVEAALAIVHIIDNSIIKNIPIKDFLVSISVGILPNETAVLYLNSAKDFDAQVDMNIVMKGSGDFVEIQGYGEEATFTYQQLQQMLNLANEGISKIIEKQK